MNIEKFFKDGGVCGALGKYDSDEHGGKPYGFEELGKDIQKATATAWRVGGEFKDWIKGEITKQDKLEEN